MLGVLSQLLGFLRLSLGCHGAVTCLTGAMLGLHGAVRSFMCLLLCGACGIAVLLGLSLGGYGLIA